MGAREAALPCSYLSACLKKLSCFAEASFSALEKSILLALTARRGLVSLCCSGA